MARMNFGVGINLNADKFKKGAKNVQTSLAKIKSSVLAMSAAFTAGTLSMGAFVKGAQQTVRDLNKAQSVLKNVTGDTNSYGEAINYINSLSKKYNAEIIGLTNNYSKFLAASKGANMSIKDTKSVFESVTQASTFFNLSADESNGVMLALTQMMSKGKIQAEELRGQLGERLPGALSTMAKALGVTTGELDKLMKDGKLIAKDVLPLFAEQLKIETSGFDKDTIEGSINALKNTWTEMWKSPDMKNAFTSLTNGLASTMQFAANNIRNIFIGTIAAMVGYATNALNKLAAQQVKTKSLVINEYKAETLKLSSGLSNIFNPLPGLSGMKKHEEGLAKNLRAELIDIASESNTANEAISKMNKALSNNATSTSNASDKYKEYYNRLKRVVQSSEANIKALGIHYGSLEKLDKATISNINNTELATAKISKYGAVVNTVSNSVKRLGVYIKELFTSNLPGIILAAITAIVLKIREWYIEQKRIRDLQKDTLKDIENAKGSSAALTSAEALVKQLNKQAEGSEEYKKILGQINKLLDISLAKEEDITKEIEKRKVALINEAKARKYADKIAELEEKRGQLENEKQRIETIKKSPNIKGFDILTAVFGSTGSIDKEIKAIDETIKSISEQFGGLYADYKSTQSEVNSSGEGTPTEGFDKVRDDYFKKIKELNNQLGKDAITVEDFIDEVNKLKESTFKAGAAFDKLNKSELDFLNSIKPNRINLDEEEETDKVLKGRTEEEERLINELKAFNKAFAEYSSVNGERNKTFDYKLTSEDRTIKDLEHQLSNVNRQYDAILEGIQNGAVGLDDIFQELINNAETLQEKLDLARINKDIEEMSENIGKMSYEGLKNMASSLDSMVNAWERLNELNEDTDASNWERFLAVFNAITQTLDGLIGIFETFNKIGKIIETISAAQAAAGAIAATQKTTEAGIIVAGNTAIAASNSLVAKTGAIAAASMIPFPGTIPAMTANMTGTAGLLASAALTPFADGGVVSGPTRALVGEYAGARNNPEAIMPLNKLQDMIDWNTKDKGLGGKVEFVLRGKDLYGSINNFKSTTSKFSK